VIVGVAAAAWLACVAGGFARLHGYEATPGVAAAPPPLWPAGAPFERAATRSTLLVFVHPRCPCTAATLEELKKLLAHGGDRLATHVICYTDPELGEAWARTGNWRTACALPGVVVSADPLGATARAFGASTSGQVLLYDRDGALRFAGGITGARGQQGDNAGEAALRSLVLGEGGEGREGRETGVAGAREGDGPVRCAVYGCSLVGPEETGS